LEDVITSANLGFQKIRKVLYRYGLDLPALYDINDDGDELALELFHLPYAEKVEEALQADLTPRACFV
jgi:hypothetical protein